MKRINLNKLAVEVAKLETSKGTKRKTREVSIGDIKEIMKILFTLLVDKYSAAQIMEMLERYIK